MTQTTDDRNQQAATLHCRIDSALGEAARQLHAAVQADVNAQARMADLEAVIDRLRRELDDLRKANRAYAQTLTDIRRALGAIEDADLAEAARSLTAENEGRRRALEQVGEERRAEWTRAERAESDLDWVMGLVRTYKAAVDAQSGVVDAQAALFRVLVEMEQVDGQ